MDPKFEFSKQVGRYKGLVHLFGGTSIPISRRSSNVWVKPARENKEKQTESPAKN